MISKIVLVVPFFILAFCACKKEDKIDTYKLYYGTYKVKYTKEYPVSPDFPPIYAYEYDTTVLNISASKDGQGIFVDVLDVSLLPENDYIEDAITYKMFSWKKSGVSNNAKFKMSSNGTVDSVFVYKYYYAEPPAHMPSSFTSFSWNGTKK